MIRNLFFLILFSSGLFAKEWQAVEGTYAIVEYNTPHQQIADSLLKIADLSLPPIARMCGYPESDLKSEKVTIILTDAPDVSNGYAIGNEVIIYAMSSAYIPNWTGTSTWYHQVLTHELVHHVTFRVTKRTGTLLGNISYLSVPRWFWEGTAQYFSERWNTYRGDIYIKNAVLTGNFNIQSLYSLENGRLLYATAHAFTRYLAEQFGDSSLIRLMTHNSDGWFYNFDRAFKAVYAKPVDKIFRDFQRMIILHYGSTWANYPVSEIYSLLPTAGFQDIQHIPLSDSTFVGLSRLKNNHLYLTAFLAETDSNKAIIKSTITNNVNTALVISLDLSKIAFGRIALDHSDNQSAIAFNWYIYDLKTKKLDEVAANTRARYAAFNGNDELVLAYVNPSGTDFISYSTAGKTDTLLRSPYPAGYLAAGPDGEILYSAQRNNGNRDLFLLKNKQSTALTDDKEDDRRAFFISDSTILISRYIDENPGMAVLNTRSGSIRPLINDQFEYWPQFYRDFSREIFAARLGTSGENELVKIPLDSLIANPVKPMLPVKQKYASWKTKQPFENILDLPDTTTRISSRRKLNFPQLGMQNMLTIALPGYDQNYGFALTGATVWLESLQRQALVSSFIWYPHDWNNSFVTYAHFMRALNIDWNSLFYHGPVFFSFSNGEWIHAVRDLAALNIARTHHIRGNSRWKYTPSLTYSWEHQVIEDELLAVLNDFTLNTLMAHISLHYLVPTKLYPVLPKRELLVKAGYSQSIGPRFDYNVREFNLALASDLFIENFGFRNKFTFLSTEGSLPPFFAFGVDRFYQYDIPRDFGFSRTIRGINRDYYGTEFLWNSFELNTVLTGPTPFKLIFLPMNLFSVTAFSDYARVTNGINEQLYSYGGEFSFSTGLARLGVGYVWVKFPEQSLEQKVFFRLSLELPPELN